MTEYKTPNVSFCVPSRLPVEQCVEVALSYRAGNYVRFFRQVSALPLLLAIATAKFCSLMLSHAVKVGRLAYKSPNTR